MDTNDELKGVQADHDGLRMYCDLFGKDFDKENKPLKGLREFTINHLFAKI